MAISSRARSDSVKRRHSENPSQTSGVDCRTAERQGCVLPPPGFDMTTRRQELLELLRQTPCVDPGQDPDGHSFHGRGIVAMAQDLPLPSSKWVSSKPPRAKEGAPAWLTATEFTEEPEVFSRKIKLLAELLHCSRMTLAYTGAGLSVSAGIAMAAVGSKPAGRASTDADPTLAHCVMAMLNKHDLLHGWVQQNHDGLPQKAGYRQEDINEIHGSWFDPSNPVVKYSGSLRGDLYEDMVDKADSADLCLVLGTSLSGLNSDQCATKTSSRSAPKHQGGPKTIEQASLGTVIISPQRTPHDGHVTLRIFAGADEVMAALAREIGLGAVRPRPPSTQTPFPKVTKVAVPYDSEGKRSDTEWTYLDLSPGAKVKVGSHHNIEGAKQPSYSHITTKTVGTVGRRDDTTCSISITFGGSIMKLGLWWLDTAQRGGVDELPIVNTTPAKAKAPSSARAA